MAELLASGTTLAASADFTLTGETSSLFLTAAAAQVPECVVLVEVKSAAETYHIIGKLTESEPAKVLSGPGTYRVSRQVCATAVGVDRV